jgi:hypothetical protein
MSQRDTPLRIEHHTLCFETQPLPQVSRVVAAAEADLPAGVYHAMPWDLRALSQGAKGISYLPGMSGDAGKSGNLSIGCHLTAGDFLDNSVNPLPHGFSFETAESVTHGYMG